MFVKTNPAINDFSPVIENYLSSAKKNINFKANISARLFWTVEPTLIAWNVFIVDGGFVFWSKGQSKKKIKLRIRSWLNLPLKIEASLVIDFSRLLLTRLAHRRSGGGVAGNYK